MERKVTGITVLIFLTITSWAFAGDPGAKLTQVAGNHQKYSTTGLRGTETMVSEFQEPTMLSEVRAVMDSTRNAERALRAEFGTAESHELTRRLGELKKASRMRILHIQLKYAREEGRAELEKRILTSIEDLQRPAAPGGPRLSGRISPPSGNKPVVKPAGGSQD